MRKITLEIVFILLLVSAPYIGYCEIVQKLNKLINTEWVREKSLKYGTLASLCSYQMLNGFCEGYHFRQSPTHLIDNENYHAFATLQRVNGIVTGWFSTETTKMC